MVSYNSSLMGSFNSVILIIKIENNKIRKNKTIFIRNICKI